MSPRPIYEYIHQILKWLNPGKQNILGTANIDWIETDLDLMKMVILMHGVGPILYQSILDGYQNLIPPPLIEWLERLYEMNSKRIQRIHAELEKILIESNKVGVGIMPLKGALLTTIYYSQPQLRPMADIDLLIKPEDYPKVYKILENFGYKLIKSEQYYANHYRFLIPENAAVVDRSTEHPDNPIPVEIHTELRRPFLGKKGEVDLTALIWKDSKDTQILNQPAIVPSSDASFNYSAVHATGHFLTQTGRILHWLDIIFLENQEKYNIPSNNLERVYIPLKLASRAFPNKLKNTNISELELHVDPRIRKWSSNVPLDGRCGLNTQTELSTQKMQKRLARWWPATWKLVITFGRIPTAIAYIKYLNTFIRQLPRLIYTGKSQE